MATVRLGRYEAREGPLPPVCVACGVRARVVRNTVVSTFPAWFYLGVPLGLLPFLLLWAFFSRRALVRAPLCTLHQFHWWWRKGALAVLFLFNFALFGLAIFVTDDPHGIIRDGRGLVVFLWLLATVLMPLVLVAGDVALRYTGVHATEVGEHSLTLRGVSEEFAEAARVAHALERGADPSPTHLPEDGPSGGSIGYRVS
jgi:hypothetical protein